MLLGLVKLVPVERCPDEAGPLGRDDHGDATSVDLYIVEGGSLWHKVVAHTCPHVLKHVLRLHFGLGKR